MSKLRPDSNRLLVGLSDFRRGLRTFRGAWRRKKHTEMGDAVIAFDGGFLTIELADVVSVIRADGEWIGRACFSSSVLRALSEVPPATDPVVIAYAEGHLLIGSLTVPCRWENLRRRLVTAIENPSLIDLLALDRTMPVAEKYGTGLAERIAGAKAKTARNLKRAAALLRELGISEDDLRSLLEERVKARLDT